MEGEERIEVVLAAEETLDTAAVRLEVAAAVYLKTSLKTIP